MDVTTVIMACASPQREMKEYRLSLEQNKQAVVSCWAMKASFNPYCIISRVKGVLSTCINSSKVHDSLKRGSPKLIAPKQKASRSNYRRRQEKQSIGIYLLLLCPLIQDLVSAAFVTPPLHQR
jgi:hypothetical protein